MRQLLDQTNLERSSVVANNLMNRQRVCVGGNSYMRELRFNPLTWLEMRLQTETRAAWLDICCGSGKALGEAAEYFDDLGEASRVKIVGVDLAGIFAAGINELPAVELVADSCLNWQPEGCFDLITCVHGLHYIGDKLGLLQSAAGWLTPTGRLMGNLDLANLRGMAGEAAGHKILGALKQTGFSYDSRRHIISRCGAGAIELPFRYLGADDQAGPNYTGQPAVNSYYEIK